MGVYLPLNSYFHLHRLIAFINTVMNLCMVVFWNCFPPVFCALVCEFLWEQQRVFSGKEGGASTIVCLFLCKLVYVFFTETLMKRLGPFYRWENQVPEKGRTKIHIEVDLGWSLILSERHWSPSPSPVLYEESWNSDLIRNSWSSICRKSCLSTFPRYPSVPKQMDKGCSTLLVSGMAFLLMVLFWFGASSRTKYNQILRAAFTL